MSGQSVENLRIRQFRQLLIETTNASQLPIEVKRLVFVEVIRQIEQAADDEIHNELVRVKAEETTAQKEGDEDDAKGVQSNSVGKCSK